MPATGTINKQSPVLSDYLTLQETAALFGKTTWTVRRWVERTVDPLPCSRMPNNALLFNVARIREWVESLEKNTKRQSQRRRRERRRAND